MGPIALMEKLVWNKRFMMLCQEIVVRKKLIRFSTKKIGWMLRIGDL